MDTYSAWTLWPEERRLEGPEGKEVVLTGLMTKILEAIVRAHGRVARIEYIVDFVWAPEKEPNWCPTKEISVFVCRLRKVLRENGVDFEIKTNWGLGFHLTRLVAISSVMPRRDCCPTCGHKLSTEELAA